MGIDGTAAIARLVLEREPMDGALFVLALFIVPRKQPLNEVPRLSRAPVVIAAEPVAAANQGS